MLMARRSDYEDLKSSHVCSPWSNCQRQSQCKGEKSQRERERERERKKALTHFCLLDLLQREEAARWGHKPRAAALSERASLAGRGHHCGFLRVFASMCTHALPRSCNWRNAFSAKSFFEQPNMCLVWQKRGTEPTRLVKVLPTGATLLSQLDHILLFLTKDSVLLNQKLMRWVY